MPPKRFGRLRRQSRRACLLAVLGVVAGCSSSGNGPDARRDASADQTSTKLDALGESAGPGGDARDVSEVADAAASDVLEIADAAASDVSEVADAAAARDVSEVVDAVASDAPGDIGVDASDVGAFTGSDSHDGNEVSDAGDVGGDARQSVDAAELPDLLSAPDGPSTHEAGGSEVAPVDANVQSCGASRTPIFTLYQLPGSPAYTIYPNQLVAGPDGNLWLAERGLNQIVRVTTQGVITEFALPTKGGQPWALTVGPDRNLWYSYAGGPKFGRITTGGSITEFDGTAGYIIAGPDGNLWGTATGAILRITLDGIFTSFALPVDWHAPTALGAGPDGKVWFVEQLGEERVGWVTAAGVVQEILLPNVPGHQHQPHRIIAGPDGNIWFTDQNVNRIARMTPDGQQLTEFPLPTGPTGFPGAPSDLTIGPDGNIWFTDGNTHAIGCVTPAGALTEFPIPGPPYLDPQGITTGSDGHIWFVDDQDARVGRLSF